jgi:putative copper resistance protein D
MLAGQALALGGVGIGVFVLRPLLASRPAVGPVLRGTLGLIALGAVGSAAAQCVALGVQLSSLADESGWPLAEALGTPFFRTSLTRLGACVVVAAAAWILRRKPGSAAGWWTASAAALALGGSSAWTSHAAARLDDRAVLLVLDALHQMAAAVWIGGLAHLIVLAIRGGEDLWPRSALQRFSAMAVACVATLLAAGLGLSLYYVDAIGALVGTAYGVMVLTKGVLFGGLLLLGRLNFLAVRRLADGSPVSLGRLWRFVEVEVAVGLTVFFTAASLTSLPPPVDVGADRATFAEVRARFTPEWPSLWTPSVDELLAAAAPIMDLRATRQPEEYAWSEYNHHLAGVFVFFMGLLAILERTGRVPWARHWPLLFLGLAGVLFVRNDPRAWPLGPAGFWESMVLPDVLQHRLFTLLVVAFGLFEWMVRAGRLRSTRCALVFPLLSAFGGGLLLTHSHAAFSLKEEFLIELTHIPLGVLALLVGSTRWLELRLPEPEDRLPGRLWAVGLLLIGVLLLVYRER